MLDVNGNAKMDNIQVCWFDSTAFSLDIIGRMAGYFYLSVVASFNLPSKSRNLKYDIHQHAAVIAAVDVTFYSR